MEKFNIFIEDQNFRRNVKTNNDISYATLYKEQIEERRKHDRDEISEMVSSCFESVDKAAILLSANGMFLKYAGPTIRSNYDLVKIAVNQNGDAIQYASVELLKSNPKIAASLILSATLGYPCEAFRKVINDESYIFEVCKSVYEMDNDMLMWVCEHMYGHSGYDVAQQKLKEISGPRK